MGVLKSLTVWSLGEVLLLSCGDSNIAESEIAVEKRESNHE
jgi:hypothetical protein